MRRILYTLGLVVVMVPALISCDSDPAVNDVPQAVNAFVQRYWPGVAIESYTDTKDGSRLVVKNGPTITFTPGYEWECVNGSGGTLPPVLLFDQLAPALYQYIQEMEGVHEVYAIYRDRLEERAVLQDVTVVYDIATGKLTEAGN